MHNYEAVEAELATMREKAARVERSTGQKDSVYHKQIARLEAILATAEVEGEEE